MKRQDEKNANNYRDIVKRQILTIRNSGLTNMFDIEYVSFLAIDHMFVELADFIIDEPDAYERFIITGDEDLPPSMPSTHLKGDDSEQKR